MKKPFLTLIGAALAALPGAAPAADCPAEKQVYEFKSTGKMLEPGTPVMKAGKAAYLKMEGVKGECTIKEEPIKTEMGVFLKMDGIDGECVAGPKGAELYTAEIACKK